MRLSSLCACLCGLSLPVACGGTVVLGEATGGDANGAGPDGTSTGAQGDEDPPTGGRRPMGGGGSAGLPTGGRGSGGHTGGVGTGGVQQPGTGGIREGTGGAEASCENNVTPCGGDVVGTWKVTSSCLNVRGTMDVSMLGLGCASVQFTEGSLAVTGTWSAYADGTYEDETLVSGYEEFELAANCAEVSGTVTTCDRLDALFFALGYEQVTCVHNGATGGCTCSATVNQKSGLGVAPLYYPRPVGSYEVEENTITIVPDEQEYAYCVAGSTLTATPESGSTTGTVTGMVVLEKQ